MDAAPRGDDAGGPPIRRLAAARWGLIPSWADDPRVGAKAFNARIETAAEKPTFRDAVVSRRAIVPATGYYEWTAGLGDEAAAGSGDGERSPYLVRFPDDEVMLLAALYEWWRDPRLAPDDPRRWVLSTSILTREAAGPLAGLHDRMPVFVGADLMDDWLDPETEGDDDLLQGISGESTQHAERASWIASAPH